MPAPAYPEFIQVSTAGAFPPGFLEDKTIHVWYLPVRTGQREGLSESEQAQASRFHQAADADRFSTARLGLRRLAGAYLNLRPGEVQVLGARHRKPVIGNPLFRAFHFNSSHSGDVVLIAFANDAVGIDVERIDPEFESRDLLPTQFSQPEREAIAATDPVTSFYQLWTRKEALTKGWGTGLQEALAKVPVLTDLVSGPGNGETWQLLGFMPLNGYAAAVAGIGPGCQVHFYQEK